MAKRKASSRQWLQRHRDDPYVKQAQREGYRSRAAYKLLEIQEKYRLIRPGMTVLDLGAAPGGWSQVAAMLLAGKGRIIATDILAMDPLEGVEFIQGDFTETDDTETTVLDKLLTSMGKSPLDLVISDMAPNISGVKAIDQPRSVYLVTLALDLCHQLLRPGGALLTKLFQGEGFDSFLRDLRRCFTKVNVCKPAASRPHSKEVYLLARDFLQNTNNERVLV